MPAQLPRLPKISVIQSFKVAAELDSLAKVSAQQALNPGVGQSEDSSAGGTTGQRPVFTHAERRDADRNLKRVSALWISHYTARILRSI